MSSDQYLHGVRAFILEQGLGKARTGIFRKHLKAKGGQVDQQLCPSTTTHLVVGPNVRYGRLPVLLGGVEMPAEVRVVRADWLSGCLVHGARLREEEYALPRESPSKTKMSSVSPGASPAKSKIESDAKVVEEKEKEEKEEENEQPFLKNFPTSSRRWATDNRGGKDRGESRDSDSDYVDSGGEIEMEKELDTSAVPPLAKRKRKWVCEIPSSEAQTWVNHNSHITDKLEELVRVYQNSGSARDKWRVMSTTKVIQALKKHPKEITTYEEARALPFVGDRLADKIMEIVGSGELRRLSVVDREKEKVLTLFTRIHGVGLSTAQQFYAQGYRSVEALAASEGVLNRQQKIGVKHYNDFQDRMPREEVTEIEEQVRSLVHQIDSGMEVITCGSYRRGKPTCGDVDILVTHCDGRSHRGVLPRLVELGKEAGFLTDDLTVHNDVNGGGKYLGVCCLHGEGRKHRRIDIYVTPYGEFPCMLLHFTGSGHFNRSMRSKADRMGMSLSEHSLNTGVIRKNGVKIFDGTPVPVFSERDIFKYLDIEYCEPKDRDWD